MTHRPAAKRFGADHPDWTIQQLHGGITDAEGRIIHADVDCWRIVDTKSGMACLMPEISSEWAEQRLYMEQQMIQTLKEQE